MKLLLVEDDENKQAHIVAFVRSVNPSINIDVAMSYQSGLRQVVHSGYDVILLDMTMPTFDISGDEEGGRPQAYAGREILRQMKRRRISSPVIVVTQFDRFGEHNNVLTLEQLDEQLATEHPQVYRGVVYYNAAQEGWKEQLASKLAALV